MSFAQSRFGALASVSSRVSSAFATCCEGRAAARGRGSSVPVEGGGRSSANVTAGSTRVRTRRARIGAGTLLAQRAIFVAPSQASVAVTRVLQVERDAQRAVKSG
jgi:hypothetical protein